VGFVKEGAYVFITGRRQAELDAAAKLMSGHVTAVKADASNLDDLDKLFGQIKREKGRLDVVYANAGGGSFAPIGQITEEHFDKAFDTNVKGTLFTVQKALPLVPDGGSIIMTSSTAGSTAMPAFSVYSATKAAIRSFARCWTLDLKDRKIRVNVISPGPIETPGIAGLAPNEEQRRGLYSMLASTIAGCLRHPLRSRNPSLIGSGTSSLKSISVVRPPCRASRRRGRPRLTIASSATSRSLRPRSGSRRTGS
jgi:NAD(P)-dependent dehydrogenase (short-subunit alcohol dehydrogenase family)